MSFKESVAVRNGRLDSIPATVGASAKLRIYTGSPPSSCSDSATGTQLVEMTLPSTWLASASGGSISKSGTWEDTSADNTGTAGYFRIYDSAGTTCHLQGTVTATGGGGDMTLNNTSITSGDDVVITSFTITAGNA